MPSRRPVKPSPSSVVALTLTHETSSEQASAMLRRISSIYGRSFGAWAVSLYTSDAADDLLCVDLGGRRIITESYLE